jgi:hypothetical protein
MVMEEMLGGVGVYGGVAGNENTWARRLGNRAKARLGRGLFQEKRVIDEDS